MFSSPSRRFPTTVWSAIRAAGPKKETENWDAMNRCIAGYWKPVFYFIRSRGYPQQNAEDLTQAFFLQFLEKNWIESADPERGKFRTYLLTILVRFLSDQGPERGRRQVTFEQNLVSVSALITDDERTYEPPASETPEEIYMKQWARAVFDNVLNNVKSWCEEKSRPDWFNIFTESFFPPPGEKTVTRHELADRLGISSHQIRYGFEETQKQFEHFLREELKEQVDSEEALEIEIQNIRFLLGY